MKQLEEIEDEAERKKVDNLFSIKRAKAAEKIDKLNKKHKKKEEKFMKRSEV